MGSIELPWGHGETLRVKLPAMIGSLSQENPMRLDIEEASRMVGGPTFIVNVVLDPPLEPVAVLRDDAVAAHRAGVGTPSGIYGVELSSEVAVVVSRCCGRPSI